ncbi:MAG TPA: S1 family peptidase [Polyangiaceae bacterium]|nr:S1 family peptidase [Polyangiaceae bacterium]
MKLRRATSATALALTLVCAGAATVVGCERATPEDIASTDSAIIGGKLDTTHKGVVSLLKAVSTNQGEGFYPACSGTLITQNLVLTAHHCVAGLNSNDGASVECGKTEFRDLERASSMIVSVEAKVGQEGLDPYRVAQVWVPPGDAAVCGRDIALLLLSGSGVPGDVATPIEPALDQDLAAHEVFAAIGYGLQDPADQYGDTAGQRMSVTNAEVFCDGAACGTAMVSDGEFIADSPVCSGDSGGPALNGSGRVSGVTSRGDEKCTVGIYSSVYAWRDFIIEKTFDAAAAGHYAPPAWAGPPPAGFDPGTVASGGSSSTGGSSGSGGSFSLAGSNGMVSAGTSAVSPTVDPLGLSCTGQCPGSYKCWAETNQPPGICVPECSAASPMCPDGFTCNTTLGACTKPQATTHTSSSCSVSVPSGPAGGSAAVWLGLGLLGLVSARRRVRRA